MGGRLRVQTDRNPGASCRLGARWLSSPGIGAAHSASSGPGRPARPRERGTTGRPGSLAQPEKQAGAVFPNTWHLPRQPRAQDLHPRVPEQLAARAHRALCPSLRGSRRPSKGRPGPPRGTPGTGGQLLSEPPPAVRRGGTPCAPRGCRPVSGGARLLPGPLPRAPAPRAPARWRPRPDPSAAAAAAGPGAHGTARGGAAGIVPHPGPAGCAGARAAPLLPAQARFPPARPGVSPLPRGPRPSRRLSRRPAPEPAALAGHAVPWPRSPRQARVDTQAALAHPAPRGNLPS